MEVDQANIEMESINNIGMMGVDHVNTEMDSINRIAKMEDFLPTANRAELTLDQEYSVTDLKIIPTRYGKKVVAVLNETCIVYLPKRVSDFLQSDPEHLEMLQRTAISKCLKITFLEGKLNPCTFKCIDSNNSTLNLEPLNKVATLGDILPTKTRAELTLNLEYMVTEVKVISTSFGEKVVVVLNAESVVYLPKRLSDVLMMDPKKLETLQFISSTKGLKIMFLEGKYNRCVFSCHDG